MIGAIAPSGRSLFSVSALIPVSLIKTGIKLKTSGNGQKANRLTEKEFVYVNDLSGPHVHPGDFPEQDGNFLPL